MFDVAGYLSLSSTITLSTGASCLYVAGQTAPGDGVTIRYGALSLKNAVHDVALRHFRMRGGNGTWVNLDVGSGERIILDHLSFSWALSKLLVISKRNVSWSQNIVDVTAQRMLFTEMFALHPTAMHVSGDPRHDPVGITNVDLHHSLFVNNSHRNPHVIIRGFKGVNNVVYNWLQGGAEGNGPSTADWVNNYFKAGPMTSASDLWEITWECADAPGPLSYYVTGNIGPHNSDPNADNWTGSSRMVACYRPNNGVDIATVIPGGGRRNQPLANPPIPIAVQPAATAYNSVLSDVGANARLSCDGNWISRIDGVDARVLQDVNQGTGITWPPVDENQAGGYPALASGSACGDTDGDGMPDAFESRYGLDSSNAQDAGLDRDGDGYNNLEEYVNGTSP